MSELTDILKQQGIGAATILAVVGPYLDRQLEAKLMELERAEPSLVNLLDLRAEIKVLRKFQRDMMSKVESAKPRAA